MSEAAAGLHVRLIELRLDALQRLTEAGVLDAGLVRLVADAGAVLVQLAVEAIPEAEAADRIVLADDGQAIRLVSYTSPERAAVVEVSPHRAARRRPRARPGGGRGSAEVGLGRGRRSWPARWRGAGAWSPGRCLGQTGGADRRGGQGAAGAGAHHSVGSADRTTGEGNRSAITAVSALADGYQGKQGPARGASDF